MCAANLVFYSNIYANLVNPYNCSSWLELTEKPYNRKEMDLGMVSIPTKWCLIQRVKTTFVWKCYKDLIIFPFEPVLDLSLSSIVGINSSAILNLLHAPPLLI